ncbi:MAG: hydrogenase maturation protease [Thermodesulfobacteriota bacterium]
MIQEFFEKKTIILGCGNPLFGDDGFGPAVIKQLENEGALPETVAALDIGTGLKDFLFDLVLCPVKPDRIFILDAVCRPGQKAGKMLELNVDSFQRGRPGGGPFHQFPSLQQLREIGSLTGVEIRILAVQAGEIPEAVRPGLSPAVQKAVLPTCEWLRKEIEGEEK